MKYKWTFANVGGVARVKIHSGEDIRHLGELDEKLWTVLSCPTTGLEIDSESLRLMDSEGDGKLHVKEVQHTAAWLCSVLRDPEVLLSGKAELRLEDIADEGIRTVAETLRVGKTPASPEVSSVVSLADVEAAIAGVSVETIPAPQAPFAADIMAAYKAKKDEYTAYFEQEKLSQLGLAVIADDAVKPGMEQAAFEEMGKAIADYEAAAAAAADANAQALVAAQAQYQPLRKLLLLSRDFYRLLRNFVTFEDFYSSSLERSEDRTSMKAVFQAGTLVIDQRACKLCLRVSDMGKQNAQADASGMFLIYCDCESKKLGRKMQIVAAMTVGDIRNLTVGKNALFYDNQGNDWDAVVTKIIDNPISISQAFWSPYRKFSAWVTNLINKSAAEKDSKVFNDLTTKVQEGTKNPPTTGEKLKMQAFDIAKFAGIFAAIGMAVGYIGAFFTKVVGAFVVLKWWQGILAVLGILLLISGPSMFLAWMKLRKRNLAPVLNANGWAINAEIMVSVVFGNTLTTQAQFPMLQLVDPSAKKKVPCWAKWLIGLAIAAIIAAAVWVALHYCLICKCVCL